MNPIDIIYTLLGQGIVFVILLIILLFIVAFILEKLLIKKNIIIFPRFIMFIIDVFYSPFKAIAKLLKMDEYIIDRISIELRNDINRKKFRKIPAEETSIFIPHCLRHKDCNGALQKEGVVCTECGKCSIGVIKKKADKLGYNLYIVPGSSFVKRIAKEKKFKAVIGVACYEDLSQIMMLLSDFYPQGVLLSKTGCFETKVNVKKVLEVMDSKYQS